MTAADPCKECQRVCQGEVCLLTSVDTHGDVAEEVVKEGKTPATSNKQGVPPGSQLCWVCGAPFHNHANGRPCRNHGLPPCGVGGARDHKATAHRVMSQKAQATMMDKRGPDFAFVKFQMGGTKKHLNLKRKFPDQ